MSTLDPETFIPLNEMVAWIQPRYLQAIDQHVGAELACAEILGTSIPQGYSFGFLSYHIPPQGLKKLVKERNLRATVDALLTRDCNEWIQL